MSASMAKVPAIIRILIADDHSIVRAGLKYFISDEKDMVVSAEAADGMEALVYVRNGECDVVLLDISMPGENIVYTLREMKRSRPELPVLILSGHSEQQFALSLLRGGASGYLNKESAPEQLVQAIRVVVSGGKYLSPNLAQVLASEVSTEGELRGVENLSKREFQIFHSIASGKSVSQIAAELALSVKTVSTYRARVLEKLRMTSNADMTYYAIKHDVIA
jgi:two-component system, NarL family, invasion response regulator UvrY